MDMLGYSTLHPVHSSKVSKFINIFFILETCNLLLVAVVRITFPTSSNKQNGINVTKYAVYVHNQTLTHCLKAS